MPTLKVRCPDCSAAIRTTIDPVDEPTDFTLTCPSCGNQFIASAEPEARPARQAAKKPTKATRRRDDDEDDDTPRKHKKKNQKAAGTNTKLIAAGVGGGVLVVGAVVALVIALSAKDKGKDVAKNEPQQQQPVPRPQPLISSPTNTGPVNPGRGTPGPVGPGSTNPGRPNPGVVPKPKDPQDQLPPGLRLPPPPKIRISGSAAPQGGRLISEKLPPFPPPTRDEDPFVRAMEFSPDGSIPKAPKLPPPSQRPLLTLDPGGHTAFVKNVFVTRKGDQVITVSEDKAVRIWNIKTGESIHTIRLPAGVSDEGSLHAAASPRTVSGLLLVVTRSIVSSPGESQSS